MVALAQASLGFIAKPLQGTFQKLPSFWSGEYARQAKTVPGAVVMEFDPRFPWRRITWNRAVFIGRTGGNFLTRHRPALITLNAERPRV